MKIDNIFKLFLLIFLLAVSSSCAEKELFGEGEGTLKLKVDIKSNLPTVSTRSTFTDEELLQSCKVYIRNSKGLIRKYTSWEEMPESVQLVADDYEAEVIAGDSVPASFTDSYYRGTKEFVITSGQSMSVKVECKIRNTVTCVALSQELAEAFSSYKIVLSTNKGNLIYTPDNINDIGYFMIADDESQLSWTFEGTMKGEDGKVINNKGRIDNVKKATKYLLTFGNSSPEVGGGMITVTVESKDLSVPDQNLVVDLEAEPIIKLLVAGEEEKGWVDISEPIYRARKSFDPSFALGVASNEELTSVLIYSEFFSQLDSNFPETTTGYDFLKMASAEVEELGRLGLEFRIQENRKSATITFNESLRKKITDNAGLYKFDLSMKDEKGRIKTQTLSIDVANLTVRTLDMNITEVWSKRATLRARILAQESVQNYRFRYKKTSESPWTEVKTTDVITNGTDYTYVLSGLQPDTEYQYQAIDDASDEDALVTCSFKTEEERQLPNSGFEDWFQVKKTYYIYKEGGDMFWDSGNPGATTGIAAVAGSSLTTNDDTKKHSGNYSAKLESNAFVGTFAAGNIFIGKYLRTEGTNGVLRFGRPWTERPTALKLWYKYISKDITNGTSLDGSKKDKGHIYVALGDWTHVEDKDGEEKDIPVLIKTKSQELFKSDSKDVIAYGEEIISASTSEDGLIELTIPITYRSNRKPTDIIVVGSASKYGDYFIGGKGSTLWLDDLKLIYDK